MKIVSNQLGPNFSLRDSLFALGASLIPWRKEKNFESLFGTPNYTLASTARTLLGVLSHKLPKDKKVGIPAVCCAVMATPFLEAGLQIQWLDTDSQGIIKIDEIKNNISELSLILAPHTFGQRADIKSIMSLAEPHKIIVVEDCAHLFLTGKPIADFRLLSFGREKDVSCVSGGAFTWRDDSPHADYFSNLHLAKPTRSWAIRHAIQPLVMSLSLNWWFSGGRLIAGAFSKARIMPRAVSNAEKNGHEDFPKTKLARTQQHILARAIRQHAQELKRRKKLAEKWDQVLKNKFPNSALKFPENLFRVIVTKVNRHEVLNKSQQLGFNLGEWDGNPIAPAGVDLHKFGYTSAQCPNAEQFISSYITFPTNRRTDIADIKRFHALFK